jgi:hypothetical protein
MDVVRSPGMIDTDATIDGLVTAGRRLVGAIRVYRALNGQRHAMIHSPVEVIEAREALVAAIEAAVRPHSGLDES